MQRQKAIEQLGYTPKEAKVYLATLELGEATISEVADKVKIPRSSAQVIMDKLHDDGLVNFYVMRRYKYWVAENPERLLSNLKQREDAMREVLPELSAMREDGWSRKHLRAQEAHGRELFRSLADASAQPVLVANHAAEIEYVNAPWEAQFGYALPEVRGKNPRIFKSGKTPEAVYERMWSSLNRGNLFQSDEIVDVRKDGSEFTLLTTIFPLHFAGQRYFVQILDDLEAQPRVERLQREVVRALQSR